MYHKHSEYWTDIFIQQCLLISYYMLAFGDKAWWKVGETDTGLSSCSLHFQLSTGHPHPDVPPAHQNRLMSNSANYFYPEVSFFFQDPHFCWWHVHFFGSWGLEHQIVNSFLLPLIMVPSILLSRYRAIFSSFILPFEYTSLLPFTRHVAKSPTRFRLSFFSFFFSHLYG